MDGSGSIRTLTVSAVSPWPLAVSVVVQGSVAVPPYVSGAVTVTRPCAIVTGLVTAAHEGSAEASVTGRPPCGAALGTPALSSCTVIDRVNPGENTTELSRMLSSPRLVTTEDALANEG